MYLVPTYCLHHELLYPNREHRSYNNTMKEHNPWNKTEANISCKSKSLSVRYGYRVQAVEVIEVLSQREWQDTVLYLKQRCRNNTFRV
jgi:hypothetical protein